MKIFKHVFMISITAVILFPVFWVVMTSLRRDEAAFSPHLFSRNLTLQHYRDLILPPDNVPHIVRDLMSSIAILPPYDTWKTGRLKKKIEKDLEKLESRIEKSSNLVRNATETFERISAKMDEEFGDIFGKFLKDLENFSRSLNTELERSEKILIAVGKLSKEKKGNWYERIRVDLDDAKKKYEEYLGRFERRYESLKKELSEIEKEISKTESELGDISRSYVQRVGVLDVLVRELRENVERLEIALSVPGDVVVTFPELSERVERTLGVASLFEDIPELYEALSKLEKISRGSFKTSKESAEVAERMESALSSILDDIEYQMAEMSDLFVDMRDLEKRLGDLISKREAILGELSNIEVLVKNRESELKDALSRVYRVYLSWDLSKRLEKFGKIGDLSKKNLTKLSLYVKSLRSKLNEARGFLKEDEISEFEKIVDSISWVRDYRSLVSSISKLEADFAEMIAVFSKSLSAVKEKWMGLFELSKTGVKVYPEELDSMYETLGSLYEGKVSSSLGIAMRSARDLSYSRLPKDLREFFRSVDADLYGVQQIWNKKPRHYFLRWVVNSVVVSGLVALITTFVCAIAAYPFSRMEFFGRKYGIMALLLIQMFPAIMYMVALYGMLKFLGDYVPWLGLDTLGGLVFVYLGGIAFNMYLMKGYYDTIPASLEESAMIDGATRFQTFWLIVVPLARPIIAVVVILTFIGTFNEFVLARIILQDVKNYTYALGLWSFSTGPFETEWGLFTAAALMGMLPMVILFLSMQRFLISGLTKGSVKG